MRVSKVTVGLSMKVQPVRFEPFDVHVGVEMTLEEGDDPTVAWQTAKGLASHQLETTLRAEVDKFYGQGTGQMVLNKAKEA